MYLRIKDGSRTVWIPAVTKIADNIFETKAILGNTKDSVYTIISSRENNTVHKIKINVPYKAYKYCTVKDADILILPYYLGNEFMDITSYNPTKDTVIVRERLRTISATELQQSDKVIYYINSILGTQNMGYYPAVSPSYEGDCDTEIKVLNKKAQYLKEI